RRDRSRRADSGAPRGRRGPRARRPALPDIAEWSLPDHAADDRRDECMTPVRVLSVASEIYPIIKTGGLADVAGALPIALAAEGVEVRSLVPGYPAVMDSLTDAQEVFEWPLFFGGATRLVQGSYADLKLFAVD